MADLTITELRDMSPTELVAHADRQRERWVLNTFEGDPTVEHTLEDLFRLLAQWLNRSEVRHACERLVSAMVLVRNTTTVTVEGKRGTVKRHTFRLMPATGGGAS